MLHVDGMPARRWRRRRREFSFGSIREDGEGGTFFESRAEGLWSGLEIYRIGRERLSATKKNN